MEDVRRTRNLRFAQNVVSQLVFSPQQIANQILKQIFTVRGYFLLLHFF